MAARARMETVAYEDAGDNFELRVKEILREMGSPDPDADLDAQRDYVGKARSANLPPMLVANTIYQLRQLQPAAASPGRTRMKLGIAGEEGAASPRPRGGKTASGVPLVTGYLSPTATLVYADKLDGISYEVYADADAGGRSHQPHTEGAAAAFAAVAYYPYNSPESGVGVEAEQIGYGVTVPDAMALARAYIRRAIEFEKYDAQRSARLGQPHRSMFGANEAGDCDHTHPPEVPSAPCPTASDCGCKHPAPLERALRWHRLEAGGYYADSPMGKFEVVEQKSDRRHGRLPWLLKLESLELRSFDVAGDAKGWAQAYGEIVPRAAAGESVTLQNPGAGDAYPLVAGKPIIEGCAPWVRVAKDPEKFAGCMDVAKSFGAIDSPKKVYEVVAPYLRTQDQEVFVVVMLDVHDEYRFACEVARGQVDKVVVDVEDIMRPVLIVRASKFWCVHNHPSGKPDPSTRDRRLTRLIRDAAVKFPSTTFAGHIVAGQKGFGVA